MKRIWKLGIGAAVVLAAVSVGGNVMAQETEAGGEVGMTLPGAAPGQRAQAAQGESDHDAVIGRFGVGYLGARSVTLTDANSGELQAPVIGLRYWLDQMIGIDAGIGFFNDGGSDTTGSTSTDLAARTAFMIHAGVPLALAGNQHFSFQIVPEVNVGIATQTEKQGNTETKRNGTTILVGVRAGAEIHFGFIDIPQLSLQGGVGILYASRTAKEEITSPGGTVTNEAKRFSVATTVNGEPWDIFTGNIAALYYF